MKKLLFTALALLTMGVAMAQNATIRTNRQVNTLLVNNSGDVTLRQDVTNESNSIANSENNCRIEDSVLMINGHDDCYVIMAGLEHLIVNSSGDVITSGTLRGKDLDVVFNSSGDTKLDLDYDNVNAYMNSSGDLVLRGKCNNLYVENNGSGDINTKHLDVPSQSVTLGGHRVIPNLAGLSDLLAELGVNLERLADSVDWDSFASDMERWGEGMEEWGRHMEEWGDQVERRMENREASRGHKDPWGGKPHYGPLPKDNPTGHFPGQRPAEDPQPRSLLFDPHWGGIDAGLNMLLGNELADADFNYLELRPMRSWVFNFNIADVGIAFNRNHVAGLYTGIGLGWNNYSFDNPVWLYKGDEHLEYELIDESAEGRLKKSKLGMLYIQAPLMVEVRPVRGFFIAAGVTGGIKVDTWMKIKFMDKYKEKKHGDYYSNILKLDATLRAGGSDMGFFASYNLLPLFVEGKGPSTHTFNVGFTLLF